jgi:hypothetical protein
MNMRLLKLATTPGHSAAAAAPARPTLHGSSSKTTGTRRSTGMSMLLYLNSHVAEKKKKKKCK